MAAQLRAFAGPPRMTLLDLVLERAATVAEAAEAAGWPESTVAHHVSVLADAGLMRVARGGCAISRAVLPAHRPRHLHKRSSPARRHWQAGVHQRPIGGRHGAGPGVRHRRPADDPATRPDPAREGRGVLGAGR